MHTNNMHIAAFMAGGLYCSPAPSTLGIILEHWDGGAFELVDRMIAYAPYAHDLLEAGAEVMGGYPGVANYEVFEPFGVWFGEQVLAADEPLGDPGHEAGTAKLRELTFAFFARNQSGDHAELRDALDAVC